MNQLTRYQVITLSIASIVSIILFDTYFWIPSGVPILIPKWVALFLFSFVFALSYSGQLRHLVLAFALPPLLWSFFLTILNIYLEMNLWFLVLVDLFTVKLPLFIFAVLPGCIVGSWLNKRLGKRKAH